MPKIGRNSPCPCKSGKKYKRCCGFTVHSSSASTAEPSAEAFQLMQIQMARHDAKEYRRRLMQGLGRPIISVEHQGYRLVAVGSELHWSQSWRTFHDFLFAYIRRVFSPDWGNAELRKELPQRHPLMPVSYTHLDVYKRQYLLSRRTRQDPASSTKKAPFASTMRRPVRVSR